MAAYHAAGSYPERTLLITFDDGYRSFRQHALPILQRYGCPAAVFSLALP